MLHHTEVLSSWLSGRKIAGKISWKLSVQVPVWTILCLLASSAMNQGLNCWVST